MGDGGSTRSNSSNSTSEKPEWLQQYNLVGKIGEGTYGLVFLARTKTLRLKDQLPSRSLSRLKTKTEFPLLLSVRSCCSERFLMRMLSIHVRINYQLAEEEEIRRLRKELVPKAQPMTYFDRPFIPSFTYHITRWMLQFFFLE